MTREVLPPEALVRLVLSPDGEVEVDYHAKLPGRGAWIQPKADLIRQVEKKPGVLHRALDTESVRVVDLLERIRAANRRAMLDLLSLAARAGCLASGAEQVNDVAKDPRLAGFIAAIDASERAVEVARSARPDLTVWPVPLTKAELGTRIGKGPRALVAICAGGPTKALVRELRRMADLR